MKSSRILRSFITIMLIAVIFSIPESSGYLSWAWRVEPQLDRSEYPPGSEGIIDEYVWNTGLTILHIYQTSVKFDWQKSGEYWYKNVSVEVKPAQRAHLAKFKFEIPDDVTPGNHVYAIALKHRHLGLREGWQDDGLQEYESTYEIFISKAEKKAEALIDIVNMTSPQEKGAPFYIGDTVPITFTLKNSGEAVAKQLKVAIEDIREKILSVMEATSAKDLEPGAIGQWTITSRGEKVGNTTAKIVFYIAGNKVLEEEFSAKVIEPDLKIVNQTYTPEEGKPVYPNDMVTATYTIKNKSPSTIKDLKLSVEVPSGLTLVESSPPINLEPDAQGELSFKIRADQPGEYKTKGFFLKSGIRLPTYNVSLTVKVSEQPGWTGIAVLGGIGVLIVVGLVLVIRKRRHKPPVMTPPSTAAVFCSKCGAPTPPTGLFCEKCGARRALMSTGILNYQGIGPRLAAQIIDGIILFILYFIVGGLMFGSFTFQVYGDQAYSFMAVYFLLTFLYFTILEGISGATVGKRLVKIKVVREDGSMCSLGTALTRNILRIIDALPFLYILGMVLIARSDRKQRLGDRLAKTVVVKSGQVPMMSPPPPPTYAPATSQTSSYSKFCISCGAELKQDATFCGRCGTRQQIQ